MALILLSTKDIIDPFAYDVLERNQVAPYRYRVLFALVFVGLSKLIELIPATWLFWFVSLAIFAWLLDAWLSLWMDANKAFAGTLYTLLLVMGFWWFHPYSLMWSVLEAIFWVAALMLMHEKRYIWLAPLVFLATLNRETTIFLVILVGLVTRRWPLTFALLMIWAVTYGGLRLYMGYAPHDLTLAQILQHNLSPVKVAHFVLGLLLFGWIPILAARGYKTAPIFLKRAIWAAPPYLAAIIVFGIWIEFRLFLPLICLVMPLVMGTRSELNTSVTSLDETMRRAL